jgi:hypothetical protein
LVETLDCRAMCSFGNTTNQAIEPRALTCAPMAPRRQFGASWKRWLEWAKLEEVL